jgi:hypothetical protein
MYICMNELLRASYLDQGNFPQTSEALKQFWGHMCQYNLLGWNLLNLVPFLAWRS